MKSQYKLALFLGLFTFLGILLCIGLVANQNREIVIPMSASWSYAYGSLDEIATRSDVIARVEIEGVAELSEGTIPHTVYSATVVNAVKGCTDQEAIKIYMTGGKIGRVRYEIEDDPLMKTGETYFIFARQNEDGTLTILGGPQGRLKFERGMLESIRKSTSLTDSISDFSLNSIDTNSTTDVNGLFYVNGINEEYLIKQISEHSEY